MRVISSIAVYDGEPFDLGAIANPWIHPWTKVGDQRIIMQHPHYPSETYNVHVYSITDGDKSVTFAAAEVSNGCWCFQQLELP